MLSPRHVELVSIYDKLPVSAVLPVPVVGAVLGLAPKTVRRLFPLISVSAVRVGVRKSDVLAHLERAVA